jgi:hypothetical protein
MGQQTSTSRWISRASARFSSRDATPSAFMRQIPRAAVCTRRVPHLLRRAARYTFCAMAFSPSCTHVIQIFMLLNMRRLGSERQHTEGHAWEKQAPTQRPCEMLKACSTFVEKVVTFLFLVTKQRAKQDKFATRHLDGKLVQK